MPPRILLVGGIGSGKSRVAVRLAALGAHTISADDVARRVLSPGTRETAAVAQRWPDVVSDGVVNRDRLGRVVFADPDALAALESITHPATRDAILDEVAEHPDVPIVVEMPILRDWFEDDWVVVVVDAPPDARIRRTVERSGGEMRREYVEQIMARQPTRSELLAAADYVIDNSGGIDALDEQCAALWELLIG